MYTYIRTYVTHIYKICVCVYNSLYIHIYICMYTCINQYYEFSEQCTLRKHFSVLKHHFKYVTYTIIDEFMSNCDIEKIFVDSDLFDFKKSKEIHIKTSVK